MSKEIEKRINERISKRISERISERVYERMDDIWKRPVLLGEGTFSKVYRVTNSQSKELVVCKQSWQKHLAEREALILAKIKHPLFPVYKGMGEWKGIYCLFMEYIPGMNLRQYVNKRGKLSLERALDIVLELSEGLLYLHELSNAVIFRDLKPENVMIQQDGRVRLLDLGCVYITGDKQNGLAGTRGYAAPEQLRAGGHVGMESDVYALGKLFHFMLTGQDTFPCRYPKGVPRELQRLLARALEVEPKKRVPDIRSFLAELAIYKDKNPIKRLWKGKTVRNSEKKYNFYFKRNIIKGFNCF